MNQLQTYKKTSPFTMIHIISKEKRINYFNKLVINNIMSYINNFEIYEKDYSTKNNADPLLNEIACSFNSLIEETELGKLMLDHLSSDHSKDLCDRFNEIKIKIHENHRENLSLSWESYTLLINHFFKLAKMITKKKKFNDIKTKEFDDITEKILNINTQIYIAYSLLKHNYKKAVKNN